jgi:hypothetical protein
MHWELAEVNAWQRQQKVPRLILAMQHEHPQSGASFSYYAVPDATMEKDEFHVHRAQLARILGKYDSVDAAHSLSLELALSQLNLAILQKGDHLRDLHDPRLYVFIKPKQ